MGDLYVTFRNVLYIVLDPPPESSAVHKWRIRVQRLHALYSKKFHVEENHSFSFTPSTHAFFHLPDLLEKKGPLLNVSQFLAERVIVELVQYVKSTYILQSSLPNSIWLSVGTKKLQGVCEKNMHAAGTDGEHETHQQITGAQKAVISRQWRILFHILNHDIQAVNGGRCMML